MKVVFYVRFDQSDMYEFPDDTSEEELNDAASEWACDNVQGRFYKIEDE